MVLLVEQKQAYRTLDCIAHAVLYACYKHKSEKTRAYKLSFMPGGGGLLPYSLGGVCRWIRERPTLYQSKFCTFCDPIPD